MRMGLGAYCFSTPILGSANLRSLRILRYCRRNAPTDSCSSAFTGESLIFDFMRGQLTLKLPLPDSNLAAPCERYRGNNGPETSSCSALLRRARGRHSARKVLAAQKQATVPCASGDSIHRANCKAHSRNGVGGFG